MRIVRTFKAVDAAGRGYTIHSLFDDPVGTDTGSREESDWLMELRTAEGKFVNPVRPGVYDITDGMETIRVTSTDPNAP